MLYAHAGHIEAIGADPPTVDGAWRSPIRVNTYDHVWEEPLNVRKIGGSKCRDGQKLSRDGLSISGSQFAARFSDLSPGVRWTMSSPLD